MNTPVVPMPVDRSVCVALSQQDAYDLFTRGMRQWWPFAGHSCSDDAGSDVVFDGRVGGAVTECARSGERYRWGTLTEWNPPHAFAMTWHPGLPDEQATRLRVTFTARGAQATDVRVLHDGWSARGAEATARRDQYDSGWPRVLAGFAQAAEASALNRREAPRQA